MFGYYLLFFGLSRVCRIIFWGLQLKDADGEDTYYTLIFSDIFYIALICDFVYNFFKHRNQQLIPYN